MVSGADVLLGIYYDNENKLWFGKNPQDLNYGDVDLRTFAGPNQPRKVRIWLADDVRADWQFNESGPDGVFESVAICPAGEQPAFGKDNWPGSDFDDPYFQTANSKKPNALLFIPDKNNPDEEWEYSIRLFSTSDPTTTYILDPKIINGSE